MRPSGPRIAPFVLPFVFGGPPQTPHDVEARLEHPADAQAMVWT